MGKTDENHKILKEKLSELYFLTEEETAEILARAKGMKEKGFDELFKLFDEAKAKQDDFILKMVEKDKSFVDNLKKSLNKMYTGTADEVTKKEAEDAEDLLKDL